MVGHIAINDPTKMRRRNGALKKKTTNNVCCVFCVVTYVKSIAALCIYYKCRASPVEFAIRTAVPFNCLANRVQIKTKVTDVVRVSAIGR